VFRAPWEAQAFALAVKLHEQGHFSWREWSDALAAEVAAARGRGDRDDTGEDYYRHWLAALEKLVAAKGLVAHGDLGARREAWARAAAAAPHGEPIVLDRAARTTSTTKTASTTLEEEP